MNDRRRTSACLVLLFMLPMCAWAGDASGASSEMSHRMMTFILGLGVILLAARMGSILAERVNLPGVLGELLVGVLIGPHLLGSVPVFGLAHGLFPAGDGFPISPELYGVCTLASVVLLFMVGLETDIGLFMRYSVAGSLVGIGGAAASFVLGGMAAAAFSRPLFGQSLGFLSPPCLFLGIISTATSVGITARILAEKRKVDTPEGVTILAGAVIDDVLGIILLGIGLGVINASRGSGAIDWGHIGLIACKAVGVWLLATAVGLAASHRISILLKWFRERSAIAVMALGLALILAGLFEEAGLAMIVGAYVMGLSLSRADISRLIREKLEPLYTFLVPIFFTGMGMLVDVRLLASREVLAFGLLYALIVNVAKILGCGLPALACGFNLRGALRIGCGMLPRGEVTLIIAGIGLAMGILPPAVFGVVVLMIFATALVAPAALVKAFESPASGLRNAPPPSAEEALSFRFPSPDAAHLLSTKLLGALAAEGFFVHTLSHRAHIHQLRKDGTVITVRQQDAELVFECAPSEVALVSTALYEVVAELERMARDLREPIDHRSIVRRMQGQEPRTDRAGLDLSVYLSERLLFPRLSGESKLQVMDELLDALVAAGGVSDGQAARQALLAREDVMSTGMEHGIALPHARTDAVDRIICAVGLKAEGVDFDCLDGQPATVIALALSPPGEGTPHVEFMAALTRCLDGAERESLLACGTPREMLAVLGHQWAAAGAMASWPARLLHGAGSGRHAGGDANG